MLNTNTQNRDKIRGCLKCDSPFPSEHRFSRLCDNCSRRNTEVNNRLYVLHVRGLSTRPLDDLE